MSIVLFHASSNGSVLKRNSIFISVLFLIKQARALQFSFLYVFDLRVETSLPIHIFTTDVIVYDTENLRNTTLFKLFISIILSIDKFNLHVFLLLLLLLLLLTTARVFFNPLFVIFKTSENCAFQNLCSSKRKVMATV